MSSDHVSHVAHGNKLVTVAPFLVCRVLGTNSVYPALKRLTDRYDNQERDAYHH